MDRNETISMSAAMGLLNVFASFGSSMASIAGEMSGIANSINSKIALKILTALFAGGTEAFYDVTSYSLNKLVEKLGNRWRIIYD